MAADLAEASGAGTGVVLATGQTQVGAASVVVPTAVFPCSKSPEQEGQVRPKVGKSGPKASESGFGNCVSSLEGGTMSYYFFISAPAVNTVTT